MICQFLENLLQTTGAGKNYKLRNQMKGSYGSIMDNITEGFERDGNKEFVNFHSFSKRSVSELKSQTFRALDNTLISKEQITTLPEICELEKSKIGAFIYYLKNSEIKGQKFKRD